MNHSLGCVLSLAFFVATTHGMNNEVQNSLRRRAQGAGGGPPGGGGGGAGGGGGIPTCSNNVARFQLPSEALICADDVAQDDSFKRLSIPNEVTWYQCSASGLIIMRSNDIPEHLIKVDNPNPVCAQNYQAEFPLNPTLAGAKRETDNIQGFAINGVIAYNALEAGGLNAVEPTGGLVDAQHWYGHAAMQGDWHYHNSALGVDDSTPISSTMQLGVAMDGFPIFGPLANPDVVLDECNFDSTNMRYHIRTKAQVDDTLEFCNGNDEAVNWKYILGCYRGDVSKSRISDSRNGQLPGDCIAVADITALYKEGGSLTNSPSVKLSETPSVSPKLNDVPSASPSAKSRDNPSASPSAKPSAAPSASPSAKPIAAPSTSPSFQPSGTPSTSPSSDLSNAPSTTAVSFVACFSGNSTVAVKGKGHIKMHELTIGDVVDIGKGRFESVYSFGHYDPHVIAKFLEIVIANKSSLRVTPDHMVWEMSRGFIPASNLRVGDQLLNSAGEEVSVKSIRRTTALGAFAPFTASGKLIVSGVLASSFVAFESQASLNVAGIEVSYQWMARTFEFPHRVFCNYLGQCPNEAYDENGISMWVSIPFRGTRWLLKQGAVLRNMLLLIVMLALGLLAVVEACLFNSWVALIVVTATMAAQCTQHSKMKVI